MTAQSSADVHDYYRQITDVDIGEVAGDVLAVQSDNPGVGLSAYRLTPTNPQKLWNVNICDMAACPIIYAGCVYSAPAGWAVCVRLADGSVAWKQKLGAGQFSSPILADGKLFTLIDEGAHLVMWRAAPEKFELLAKATIGAKNCTTPTIAGGRLYLRLEKGVACYDLTESAGVSQPQPATR